MKSKGWVIQLGVICPCQNILSGIKGLTLEENSSSWKAKIDLYSIFNTDCMSKSAHLVWADSLAFYDPILHEFTDKTEFSILIPIEA